MNWIPCKDRMPTPETPVLTINDTGEILVCDWCPQRHIWAMPWSEVNMHPDRISHWMPLPEPPAKPYIHICPNTANAAKQWWREQFEAQFQRLREVGKAHPHNAPQTPANPD